MGPLKAGSIFGKYRIFREIGRGGMGVVYLAEDATLGRQVALKILDRSITSDPHFEQRFLQEARTVAGLQHPNIVPIHALEKIEAAGEHLVIDMAYIEGGSLADAETMGNLGLCHVVAYMRDILLALACCHEAGIVHRDVKPNNILLSPDGRALLSDFGLAKLMEEHQAFSVASSSSSGFFMGTPRYAPPESWDGAEPTPAWDVYSTGMVLFEAAASRTPYDAATPLSLMKQMIERPIPRLMDMVPAVSPALSGLVGAMLERDPAKRPPDAGAVLEKLEQVPELAQDAAVTAIRRIRPLTKTRFRRRRWTNKKLRVSVGVLTGVLLLTILIGVAAFLRGGYPSLHGGVAAAPNANQSVMRLYDVIDTNTHAVWKNQAMLLPESRREEPAPDRLWSLLIAGNTYLWRIEARNGEGQNLALSGQWAEYTDASARFFRYGTVSGSARWHRENQEITLSLTFQCAQDGSENVRSFAMIAAEEKRTDVELAESLEDNETFQPLLYSEMLPRHLPWALDVERQFLLRNAHYTTVRRMPPNASAPSIDGVLNEAVWRSGFMTGGPGQDFAEGIPATSHSAIHFLHDDRFLYLGVHVGKRLVRPRLVFSLLPRFGVPARQSPRWWAQIDGGAVAAARRSGNNKTEPWDCAWKVAEHAEGESWEMEFAVPFDNLERGFVAHEGDRWRLNAVVTEMAGPDAVPVARWGKDDFDQVEHGLLAVFVGD